MRHVLYLFVLICSVLLVVRQTAHAQHPLSLAGQRFCFGIIEGPETLQGEDTANSSIRLTVVSPYDGTGNITSSSGLSQSFTFSSIHPTIITLPKALIHLTDTGVTRKGVIVTTNQPVSLTLHDIIPGAGEATQIYPDESLDTDYYCPSWGLWDDSNGSTIEKNHSEILVTAAQDNTVATLIPSVTTIAGDSAAVPIRVTLNAGECYILKADTSHGGAAAGLSGTTVHSTKPVSVIVGTTCAYVPLALQSCNELMDEITGRRYWGQTFYIAPLGNSDTTGDVRALLTSDRPFYYTINDQPGVSSGRTFLSIAGAARIFTSEFSELQELAVGSMAAYLGRSDPTLVTIPDSASWSDTMIWKAASIVGDIDSHFVSIVYPFWRQSDIRLDGHLLDSLKPSNALIPGGIMRALVTGVDSGVHIITSPVPIFAIASGWGMADGYSFLPGTMPAAAPLSVPARSATNTIVRVSPNPGFGRTDIYVSNAEASHACVRILNLLGEVVAQIFDAELAAGEHSFEWDSVSAGVYECMVQIGDRTEVGPIVICH